MRRTTPFQSREEVDAYLAGDTIQCLECGRWFRSLGSHLARAHTMTGADYKSRWAIPAGCGLAGRALREAQAALVRHLTAEGRLTRDHLPAATAAARGVPRWPRTDWLTDEQRAVAAGIERPTIPPGGKRADGRDADRAREYQRAYRNRKKTP